MTPKKAGFTLIELIIVMAIIGIFTAMMAPTFQGFQTSSRMNLSVDLIQARLSEGMSQARSSRMVRIVKGDPSTNQIILKACPQVVDPLTDAIMCDSNACEDIPGGPDDLNAIARGIMLETAFDVRYFPPHGDVIITGESEPISCVIPTEKKDHAVVRLTAENGATREMKIHGLTGLVDHITEPIP